MTLWHQVLSDQNSKAAVNGQQRDTAADVLQRESYVLLGGSFDGMKAAAVRAVEEPGETAVKLASSAAIGGAFAYLHTRPGLVGITGRVAAGALAVSFAMDIAGRLKEMGAAVSDAAQSGENLEANRAVIAGTVGPFVVDSAIMTAGGAGGALAARAWFPGKQLPTGLKKSGVSQSEAADSKGSAALQSRTVSEPPTPTPQPAPKLKAEVAPTQHGVFDAATIESASAGKDLYWNAWPSIIKVTKAGKSGASTGTGFILTEDGLAITNYHVVANADMVAAYGADGRLMRARVAKVDPTADLALIRLDIRGSKVVDGKRVFVDDKLDPINLAVGSDQSFLGSTVYAFGHNHSLKDMAVAVGKLTTLKANPRIDGMAAPLNPKLEVFEGNAFTRKGFSGGPVVNESGEVVAVNFASNQDGVSLSIPMSALREFIKNQNQHRTAEFWRGIVPLLKQAKRTPQETPELADIFAASQGSIFKVRAIKGGQPEVASGFLVSESGHVVTSSNLTKGAQEIVLNKNGVWSIPMQVETQLVEGLTLLKPDPYSRHLITGTPFRLALNEPNVVASQRLSVLGYPQEQMQLFAAPGEFGGFVQKSPHNLLGLGITLDKGFAGAPVLNRNGRVVGVSFGGEPDFSMSFAAQGRVIATKLRDLGIAVDGQPVK